MENELFKSINESIEKVLNEKADNEIENLVKQFRNKLIEEKANIISSIVAGLEITSCNDYVQNRPIFRIEVK